MKDEVKFQTEGGGIRNDEICNSVNFPSLALHFDFKTMKNTNSEMHKTEVNNRSNSTKQPSHHNWMCLKSNNYHLNKFHEQ